MEIKEQLRNDGLNFAVDRMLKWYSLEVHEKFKRALIARTGIQKTSEKYEEEQQRLREAVHDFLRGSVGDLIKTYPRILQLTTLSNYLLSAGHHPSFSAAQLTQLLQESSDRKVPHRSISGSPMIFGSRHVIPGSRGTKTPPGGSRTDHPECPLETKLPTPLTYWAIDRFLRHRFKCEQIGFVEAQEWLSDAGFSCTSKQARMLLETIRESGPDTTHSFHEHVDYLALRVRLKECLELPCGSEGPNFNAIHRYLISEYPGVLPNDEIACLVRTAVREHGRHASVNGPAQGSPIRPIPPPPGRAPLRPAERKALLMRLTKHRPSMGIEEALEYLKQQGVVFTDPEIAQILEYKPT
ncbi:MAG: hypothetical protein AAF355_11360 [Myxococcota bacterium]